MKILHVIPDLAPATGGPVTSVLGLARAQAELGHEVSIASTEWGLAQSPPAEGVTIHLFPCKYDQWRWSPALGQFLKRNVRAYDVVTVESLWQYPTLAGGKACRDGGVPYVVSTNGMLDAWSLAQKAWKKKPYLYLFERSTIEGASGIHVTSKGELANSHLEKWNTAKLVIPLGVDSSSYDDLPGDLTFYRRHPELSGRRIVLFLGRLHYKKQPDVAIRAFHEACWDDDDVCLVLAGRGEAGYVRHLRDLVEELGIREKVFFTGLLRGNAVKEAYVAASVFVLPSWQENFGLSVVEAMAAGCPVVVSDQIDLAADIAKGGAGLSVAPNVEETAAALRLILNDHAMRAEMGRAGRRLVVENYTWERSARSFTRAFEDILSGRRTSPAWH